MAQNQAALQAFVDSIHPNVAEVRVVIRRDVVWRPDPETGAPIDVMSLEGVPILFETEIIHVKIGRCACTFETIDGADKGPPDLRRPLTNSEIEKKLREALEIAAIEASKGRPSETKAEKSRQDSIARARQLLRDMQVVSPNPIFRYRKPRAALSDILMIAVRSGRMTQEEADARLAEGEDRDDPPEPRNLRVGG